MTPAGRIAWESIVRGMRGMILLYRYDECREGFGVPGQQEHVAPNNAPIMPMPNVESFGSKAICNGAC